MEENQILKEFINAFITLERKKQDLNEEDEELLDPELPKKTKQKEEMNSLAGGGVPGWQQPLGTSSPMHKGKKKRNIKKLAKHFGGGKPTKIKKFKILQQKGSSPY